LPGPSMQKKESRRRRWGRGSTEGKAVSTIGGYGKEAFGKGKSQRRIG